MSIVLERMVKEIIELLEAKRKANIKPVSLSEIEIRDIFGDVVKEVRALVREGKLKYYKGINHYHFYIGNYE
jgi:hypothetical protein